MSSFRAIVLAAGKGTRLKSKMPKVLHPLMKKPLLKRVLETLDCLSVEQACTIVGHQAETVLSLLETWQFSFAHTTVVQEPQLGTGHAVLQVKAQLPEWNGFDGMVLILSGDVPLIQASSLKKLLATHQDDKNALTVLSSTLANPFGYGRILLDGNQCVKAIVEQKDATPEEQAVKQVNTGIYCLNWKRVAPFMDQLSSNNAQGEFYLTDLIALSVKAGERVGMCLLDDPDEMLGVNARQDLAKCHRVLNQRTMDQLMSNGVTIVSPESTVISPEVSIAADTTILPGCILEDDITIGSNCLIGPYTTMSGTVRVGDNVKIMQSSVRDSDIGSFVNIGPYAQLRDDVKLADYVNIGNFVEIKQSEIDHHTNAAHLSYIGNATLGRDVNIGAGTITANYDPVRDIKSDTRIENNAKVGSNSVLIAPITVEENASVAAGSVVTQTVPANSLAVARGRQTNIENWVTKAKSKPKATHPNLPLS